MRCRIQLDSRVRAWFDAVVIWTPALSLLQMGRAGQMQVDVNNRQGQRGLLPDGVRALTLLMLCLPGNDLTWRCDVSHQFSEERSGCVDEASSPSTSQRTSSIERNTMRFNDGTVVKPVPQHPHHSDALALARPCPSTSS